MATSSIGPGRSHAENILRIENEARDEVPAGSFKTIFLLQTGALKMEHSSKKSLA